MSDQQSATAAERRGLDLSSAPEHVRAILNRVMHLEEENERFRAALERIAAPRRPDRTYNLSREACEQLARVTLGGHP